MEIKEGKNNKLCFNNNGKYSLKPLGECYMFANKEFLFDTSVA